MYQGRPIVSTASTENFRGEVEVRKQLSGIYRKISELIRVGRRFGLRHEARHDRQGLGNRRRGRTRARRSCERAYFASGPIRLATTSAAISLVSSAIFCASM